VPIDLAAVNWVYVGLLAIFVFVASLVGHVLTLGHRGYGALLSAILFAAIFVAWSYYPHGLPLPTRLEATRVAAPAPPAASPPAATTAPARPANPVTTISPPANPVTTISPPANPVTTISPPPAAPKQ
jgi:hypothetical protein